jgi:phosphotransferase system HPr (HPr) family protein
MQSTQVMVVNEVGLHARPAAQFVALAGKHKSNIQIRNLTSQGKWCNAKSILAVLTLGVEKNHTVEITADGPDEGEAIDALKTLILSNFGEGA